MRRAFILFCFFPLFSFAETVTLDQSQLNALTLWPRTISQQDLPEISSDTDNIRKTLNNFYGLFNNINLSSWTSYLSNIKDYTSVLDSIDSGISSLVNLSSSSPSDYSEVLNNIYGRVVLSDNTLSSIDNYISRIASGVATEETLSSIDSYLAGISDEVLSTLPDLATEATLSKISSDVSSIKTYYSDSSKLYDDSKWETFRNLFVSSFPSFPIGNGTPFRLGQFNQSGLSVSTVGISSSTPTDFLDMLNIYFSYLLKAEAFVSRNTSYSSLYLSDFSKLFYIHPSNDRTPPFSLDSVDYALIDFESNSVPEKVSTDYLQNKDWFTVVLTVLKDSEKMSASQTMFLKHIRERLPDLKSKDTKADEDRIEQSISDTSSQLDSLKQSFEFSEISFKDSSEFFDGDSILSELKNSYCPSAINLRIPEFMGMPEYVVSVLVSDIQPFLDVSRAVFGCVYFVLIAGFIWFVFRLFIPVLSRFSKLLATVLNW